MAKCPELLEPNEYLNQLCESLSNLRPGFPVARAPGEEWFRQQPPQPRQQPPQPRQAEGATASSYYSHPQRSSSQLDPNARSWEPQTHGRWSSQRSQPSSTAGDSDRSLGCSWPDDPSSMRTVAEEDPVWTVSDATAPDPEESVSSWPPRAPHRDESGRTRQSSRERPPRMASTPDRSASSSHRHSDVFPETSFSSAPEQDSRQMPAPVDPNPFPYVPANFAAEWVLQEKLRNHINLLNATERARNVSKVWAKEGKIYARLVDDTVVCVYNKADIWAIETMMMKSGATCSRPPSTAYLFGDEREQVPPASPWAYDSHRGGSTRRSPIISRTPISDMFGWSTWGPTPLYPNPPHNIQPNVAQAPPDSAFYEARVRWNQAVAAAKAAERPREAATEDEQDQATGDSRAASEKEPEAPPTTPDMPREERPAAAASGGEEAGPSERRRGGGRGRGRGLSQAQGEGRLSAKARGDGGPHRRPRPSK